MENPYASPSSDTSRDTAVRPGILEVRWAKPAVATFAKFVMLWSFCTGIIPGALVFVLTLFGAARTELELQEWHFEGISAGLAAMLFAPLLFLMLGSLVTIWFPVFRLLAAITGGLRLRFRDHHGRELHFSSLCLRSFILLASLCGLFCGLLVMLVALVLFSSRELGSVSIPGIPAVMDGVPGVAWKMFVVPVMFAACAGLLAVPAFLPFRYLARIMRGAVLHGSEITPGR